MSYKVNYTSKAKRDLKKLPLDIAQNIILSINGIKGEPYSYVRKLSDIHCITTGDWLDAATIRSEMRKKAKDFGMIGLLIVSQQRRLGCKVVSGDAHFVGVEGAVLL